MGQVYLAHDTLLDRPVAIKFPLLPSPLSDSGQWAMLRERFFVEARAIARLQHPNIVAIHRIGEWCKRPYLVSELVRGESLDRLPRPLHWQRVLEIGRGAARGLSAAHCRRVLHRDIKPANIMLAHDGNIKLLDFGLAKVFEAADGSLSLSSLPAVALHVSAAELPPVQDQEPAQDGLAATRRPKKSSVAPAAPPDEMPAAAKAPGPGRTPPAGSLTQVGDLLGSPLYMAPEQWLCQPTTRQADIYSLGVVLFELCTGRRPYEGNTLEELSCRVLAGDAPPLSTVAPSVHAGLAAVIDRCLRSDPAARFDSAEEMLAALEELLEHESQPAFSAAQTQENPYRGLLSFEIQHRGQFFGREAEVRALLERLRADALTVVTGDSGVGKSSLCQAGALAAIQAGALGAGLLCRRLTPGRRPLWALARALVPALERNEFEIVDLLSNAPETIGRALRRRNSSGAMPCPLLLFIDQMEELFTQSEAASLEPVGRALLELCNYAPDVRLLACVRSDFLSRLAALPALGKEVGRALFLLGPLTAEGLHESIVRPALAHGYRFESEELVDSLVNAASQTIGGLPLLQFSLSALWELRDERRRMIPQQAFEKLGGLGGALARYADGVIERMLPAQRRAAQELLGQLVSSEGTRMRRTHSELLSPFESAAEQVAAQALEALVQARILNVYAGGHVSQDSLGAELTKSAAAEDGESQYELIHEALLSSWNTLRSWLLRDSAWRAARQRLGQAAAEWERLGRARELLWQPVQLRAVKDLLLEKPANRELSPRDLAFLRASQRAARFRLSLRLLLLCSAPLLGGALLLFARLRASQVLEQQAEVKLTTARRELARAHGKDQRVTELRREAFKLFDGRHQAEGERLWEQQLELAREVRQAYRGAGQAAEAAFMLRSTSQEARDTLATVLFEQATVAERNHSLDTRDELLSRVWLFDADGSYRRRFMIPAMLAVASRPVPAELSVIPIDERKQLLPKERRKLGRTPLAAVPLPPGSYLLLLEPVPTEGPARPAVRYPLLVERGETLQLSVYLPPAARVPPDFAYVPAGRALFGSDAIESERRDFLYHVPMHTVKSGGFLIARHETTYEDWLLFLRHLPALERTRRMPRAGQAGVSGGMELRQMTDGSFELTLQPTRISYHVREGELLRFAAIGRRPPIDWRKLPVTGISAEDATAYLSWLNESGKVPNARLCSEIEWERAARGADGRHYPHGDELRPSDAAFDQTYAQDPGAMGPDLVGSHPASQSLFQVDDLVGNAFEWVTNSVSDKAYALRGGAYYYGGPTCRLDNRQESLPTLHDLTVGLRVCATLSEDE